MPDRGAAWRTTTLSQLPWVACTANHAALDHLQTAGFFAESDSSRRIATLPDLQLLEERLNSEFGFAVTPAM